MLLPYIGEKFSPVTPPAAPSTAVAVIVDPETVELVIRSENEKPEIPPVPPLFETIPPPLTVELITLRLVAFGDCKRPTIPPTIDLGPTALTAPFTK
jgi:hypothetical protein